MIELNFSPRSEDYMAAFEAHRRRNWAVWASLGFSVLALIFHILRTFLVEREAFMERAGLAVIVLVFCLGIALFSFVLSPMRVQRVLRDDPKASAAVKVKIDDAGLHTSTSFAQNENPWENFSQLIETPQVFMLMGHEQRTSFQVLPKRAFANADDQSKFKALAEEKLGPSLREKFSIRNLIAQLTLALTFFAALVLFLRLIGVVSF